MTDLTYDRPVATPVEVLSTALALSFFGSELPTSEEAIDSGDQGILRITVKADADESGGAAVTSMWRVDITPQINPDTGALSLLIAGSPITGAGVVGTAQSMTVPHTQNADAWQTAAGRARQDPP